VPLQKRSIQKPDGRRLHFYAFARPLPDVLDVAAGPQREAAGALELRWNPLLEEWVIVATERQKRTYHPPAEYCPFCPTKPGGFATEVPASDYEIVSLENCFPSFRGDAPEQADTVAPYDRGRAGGECEVVLYSAEHDSSLGFLTPAQARALIDVWADRYRELAGRPDVQYVFIFENRGPEIGVTLTHPHGQIYAFPYVPPRIERELVAAARHAERTGRCLQCAAVGAELADGQRIVVANPSWAAFVPFAARWPYEVHLASREHRESLLDLSADERAAFAQALQTVLQKYDHLWGYPMPYVLSMHQAPTDGVARPGCHLHVELTPPYRSRERLKYLAGCETGAGTFINDTLPEERAAELRAAAPVT
jgi:UDPglucose--hexose-1-phosphate uridylyltransferase